MSIHSEIRLHEALKHAHGLTHHVKVWLAQPSRRLMTGHVPGPTTPASAAPTPSAPRAGG